MGPTDPTADASRYAPIASYRHTLLLVVVALGPAVWAYLTVQVGDGAATTAQATRPSPLPFYALSVAFNSALAYLAWVGVHHRGGKLSDLIGSRRPTLRGAAITLAIALPFLLVWEIVARSVASLLGSDTAGAAVANLLPRSPSEVAGWLAVCLAAGFCEELVFRGYLQRQFLALTHSRTAAIGLQALIFACGHFYKGWRQVVVIFVLGLLYGILALFRPNLRENMVAHAISDVYEGWLRFL